MRFPLIALELRRIARHGFIGPIDFKSLLMFRNLAFVLVICGVFVYIGWTFSIRLDKREIASVLGGALCVICVVMAYLLSTIAPLFRGAGAMDDERKNNPWPFLILADISPAEFYASKLVQIYVPYLRNLLALVPLFVIGAGLVEFDTRQYALWATEMATFTFWLCTVAVLFALLLDDRGQIQLVTLVLGIGWIAAALVVQRAISSTRAQFLIEPWSGLYAKDSYIAASLAICVVHLVAAVPQVFASLWLVRRRFARWEIRSLARPVPIVHFAWARKRAGALGRLYLAGTGTRQSVVLLRYLPFVALPLALVPYPVLLPIVMLVMTYTIVGSVHDARENGSFTLLSLACDTNRALAKSVRQGHVAQFLPLLAALVLLRLREYYTILDPNTFLFGSAVTPLLIALALIEAIVLIRLIVSISCWSVIDARPSATHSFVVLLFIGACLWSWLETVVKVPFLSQVFSRGPQMERFAGFSLFVAIRVLLYFVLSEFGMWQFRIYIRKPIGVKD
jgi:hypothetical protein